MMMKRLSLSLLLTAALIVAPLRPLEAADVCANGQGGRLGCNGTHIATQGTFTLKSGSGALHSISINTIAASSVVTVYDNTAASGTVIAVVTTAALATLLYDITFVNGLTVAAATANPDITVSWQ